MTPLLVALSLAGALDGFGAFAAGALASAAVTTVLVANDPGEDA